MSPFVRVDKSYSYAQIIVRKYGPPVSRLRNKYSRLLPCAQLPALLTVILKNGSIDGTGHGCAGNGSRRGDKGVCVKINLVTASKVLYGENYWRYVLFLPAENTGKGTAEKK